MQDEIQICAIIPTFNRASTLTRCIDSIISQTHKAAEIIVIDDGSTDDTKLIVDAYKGRISYFYQENQGVSSARNSGVEKARFDWIAFLDSDDFWASDYLEKMARAISKTDGAAAVYFSNTEVRDGENCFLYWDVCEFICNEDYEYISDASRLVLSKTQPTLFQSCILNKEAIKIIGLLPVGLRTREDTYLFYKLGFMFPFCAVSCIGTFMTSDGTNRLTTVLNSHSLDYHLSSLFIYSDLLKIFDKLRPEYISILRDYLSSSHYSFARYLAGSKSYVKSGYQLFKSFYVSPKCFIRSIKDTVLNKSAPNPSI